MKKQEFNGTIMLKHSTIRKVITSKNIMDFKIMANRRDVRRTEVNDLCRVLEANKHFESPLMANENGRTLCIIDGNHRVEAIKKFLKVNPNAGVEVEIQIFHKLDDDEEKEMYTKYNKGAKQGTADVIKLYWDVLNIQKKINTTDFPVKVSHKSSYNHIALNKLVWAYLNRNTEVYIGDARINAFALVDIMRGWNGGRGTELNDEGQTTYNNLFLFTNCYTKSFGKFDRNNFYWNSAIFSPMFRIWWENREDFTQKELVKRFQRLTTKKGRRVVENWKSMGASTTVCTTAIRQFLQIMNKGEKRNESLFIYGNNRKGDRARIYGVERA